MISFPIFHKYNIGDLAVSFYIKQIVGVMNSFYKVHPQLEMDEVKLFLLKNIHYLGEKLFSKHFPELYKDISQITFPFPIKKFSQKL